MDLGGTERAWGLGGVESSRETPGCPGGRGGCRGEAMGVVRLSAEEGQWGRARWRAVERRLGVLFLLQAGWG